ncbi:MAG: toll/interleukin-1 receptor domain-containing protein [Oceanicaulis sp.]
MSAAETGLSIFLSYSRQDSEALMRLHAALLDAGHAPDYDQSEADPDSITSGISADDEWWLRLEAMIASADVFVLLVSPAMSASKVVDEEIAYARQLGKRIIPVLVEPVDYAALPPRLRALNIKINLARSGPGFETAFAQLLRVLALDVTWLRSGADLVRAAKAWDEHTPPRPRDLLLQGASVDRAQTWLENTPTNSDAPGELVREYIKASRINRARQIRNRRRAAVAAALLLAGVLGLSGLLLAMAGQSHLREAFRLLQAAGRAVEDGYPDRGVRLAMLAGRDVAMFDGVENDAVGRTLTEAAIANRALGRFDLVEAARESASSPIWLGEERIAAIGASGAPHVIDAGSGAKVDVGASDLQAALGGGEVCEWNRSGAWLAVAHCDGTIALVDLTDLTAPPARSLARPEYATGSARLYCNLYWNVSGTHLWALCRSGRSGPVTVAVYTLATDEWRTHGRIYRSDWLDAAPSPDGTRLAFALANQHGVHVVTTPAAESDTALEFLQIAETWCADGDLQKPHALVWEENGLTIADGVGAVGRCSEGANDTEILDAAQGVPARALKRSPDGRLLAAAYADGRIRVLDAETGALVTTPGGHGPFYRMENGGGELQRWMALDWSARGRLLSLERGGELRTWVVRGASVRTRQPLNARATALAFDPAGERLAIAVGAGPRAPGAPPPGLSLLPLDGDGLQAPSPLAHRDQTSLLEDVEVWPVVYGRVSIVALAFSPDGAHLAAARNDGEIVFYQTGEDQEALRFLGAARLATQCEMGAADEESPRYVIRDGYCFIIDPATGEETGQTSEDAAASILALKWETPDTLTVIERAGPHRPIYGRPPGVNVIAAYPSWHDLGPSDQRLSSASRDIRESQQAGLYPISRPDLGFVAMASRAPGVGNPSTVVLRKQVAGAELWRSEVLNSAPDAIALAQDGGMLAVSGSWRVGGRAFEIWNLHGMNEADPPAFGFREAQARLCGPVEAGGLPESLRRLSPADDHDLEPGGLWRVGDDVCAPVNALTALGRRFGAVLSDLPIEE